MTAVRRRKPAPSRGVPKPDPRLKTVQPVEDPAVEQRLSRQLVQECVKLRETRGEKFRKPRSKDQPWQTLDELDLMLSRGEINGQQFEAGRRYGDRYREAMGRGVYRSSIRLNDRSRTGANYDAILLDRVAVFGKLNYDRESALDGRRRVVDLCDLLLGEDYRVDAGRAGRKAVVAVMDWALTRLAYHYGLIWWRDEKRAA